MNSISSKKSLVRCVLATFFLALALPAIAAEKFRTWTDSTGDFKLEAKFVSKTTKAVKLLQKNGASFEIPLDKLSKADQEYVKKNFNPSNPFKKTGKKNPFQKSSKGSSTGTGATLTPKSVKVNLASADLISLVPETDEWKYQPPADNQLSFNPKNVSLPPKKSFFEGLKGVVISPVAKRAAIGFLESGRGRTEGRSRVLLCSLTTGRVIASASEAGDMTPIALHDDGQRILMRRNVFGFGNLDRLEVWSIVNSKISRGLSWTPYEDVSGAARDVMWAEFLDNDRLVTSSRGGKVVVWEFETLKPLYQFQLENGAVPTLSSDRKTIAFCANERVGLIDVETRKLIAMRSTPGKLQWPYVAFSPDGTRLACIAFDRILVWNATNGELLHDFKTPGISIHGNIDFPDNNFLLANNTYLIDLQNHLKLWQYTGASEVQSIAGTTFFAMANHRAPGALIAAELPHPAAHTLLEKAINRPDLFIFKEGTRVKLDVSGIPVPQQKRVRDALTKKLQTMNCPVADNGTIQLVASISGPKQKEMTFTRSGTYKVTEYTSNLEFKYEGKSAWSTRSTNLPHFVSIKRGENLSDILKKKSQGPSYHLYDSVVLPKFLQNPTGGKGARAQQTLGTSRITANGIK